MYDTWYLDRSNILDNKEVNDIKEKRKTFQTFKIFDLEINIMKSTTSNYRQFYTVC